MKVAVFDSHTYDVSALVAANHGRHDLDFVEARLDRATVELAKGSDAVCCFVNDRLDEVTLIGLAKLGVKLVALRCAGFNNVDLDAARREGVTIVRVPEYSPHAVAEHAVALLMTLNRKIHKANSRVHESNFTLDGLVGFDVAGKTIGVVGTGRIGKVFARIMRGFDAKVVAFDASPDVSWAKKEGVDYVSFESLIDVCDVVSLHVPLTPSTHHMISEKTFARMKRGCYLLNTGRGGLIDTKALIAALKAKRLGGACLDVYEEEEGVFFSDLSDIGLDDDVLARLTTFPNVLITSHQAFLTHEALSKIADVTIDSISRFESGVSCGDREVRP